MPRVVMMLVWAGLSLVPAAAQAQSPPDTGARDAGAAAGRTELALGPHIIRREQSSDTHVGGGLMVALGSRRAAGVVEAGGTRRDGHNDWRVLAGLRTTLVDGGRTRLYLQGLAGTLIRSGAAGLALMPGLGLDVGRPGTAAIRFQVDVPVERANGTTRSSARASVWLVLSPLGR